MSVDTQSIRVRRYLLQETTDEESSEIEREYLNDPRALDAIAAVEDALIEDYLDGELPADERTRFERAYLASEGHRRRVDTIRRLRAAAATDVAAGRSRTRLTARAAPIRLRIPLLVAAAVIVLAAGVSIWLRAGVSRRAAGSASIGSTSASRPAVTQGPRVFAFTVPASTLRGEAEAPSLVIPPDTDVVALEIAIEDESVARGEIRAVGGGTVWVGPVRIVRSAPASIARLEVPAARLQPDDYIVTLTTGSATPEERGRYALHVRAH